MEAFVEVLTGVVGAMLGNGRSLDDDPFAGMEMGEMGQRQLRPQFMERTLEEVVKSLHQFAENVIPDFGVNSNKLVGKREVLDNTFVSFYECEFKAVHTVRWVPWHSVLAEYLRHSGRGKEQAEIGVYQRQYATMAQFPEATINQALEELHGLFKHFILATEEDWSDDEGDGLHIDEIAQYSNGLNCDTAVGDGKGKGELIEKENGEERLGDQPSGMSSVSLDSGELDPERNLARHIYQEVMFTAPKNTDVPTRDHLFYNMAHSVVAGRNGSTFKVWFVFHDHAYATFLREYTPYDIIRTNYGTCCVYFDHTMQQVVGSVMSLLREYKLDVTEGHIA